MQRGRREGRGCVGSRVLGILAVVVVAWGASAVQAQTRYHCRSESGTSFVSSRPCPEGTRTTAAVAGPAPAQNSSPRSDSYSPVRSAPEVPDHYQYLSARCRALDENVRGAYGRGIKADVVEGMRREYRRDCQEEESEAYSRLSSERRSRDTQRREEERSAQVAVQTSREQQERHAQQCAESRRILTNKRAKTDLTDGEKNDLRRFEEAFLERCKR